MRWSETRTEPGRDGIGERLLASASEADPSVRCTTNGGGRVAACSCHTLVRDGDHPSPPFATCSRGRWRSPIGDAPSVAQITLGDDCVAPVRRFGLVTRQLHRDGARDVRAVELPDRRYAADRYRRLPPTV